MMALLLSKPAGRKHTAAVKIVTLWAASAVVCLLFYGSNLILAWKLAGLGPLDRPIQTLTGFYSSPWELSAGTYLVIFYCIACWQKRWQGLSSPGCVHSSKTENSQRQ